MALFIFNDLATLLMWEGVEEEGGGNLESIWPCNMLVAFPPPPFPSFTLYKGSPVFFSSSLFSFV